MDRNKLQEATMLALQGKLTEDNNDTALLSNLKSVFNSGDWEFEDNGSDIIVRYNNEEYDRVTTLYDQPADEDYAVFDKTQEYTIKDIEQVKNKIIKEIKEFIKYYNKSHRDYAKESGDYEYYDQSNWTEYKETGKGKPPKEIMPEERQFVIDSIEEFKKRGIDMTDFIKEHGIGKGYVSLYSTPQLGLWYMCKNINRDLSDPVFKIICDPYMYTDSYHNVYLFNEIAEFAEKNNDSLNDLQRIKELSFKLLPKEIYSAVEIIRENGVNKLSDIVSYLEFIEEHNYSDEESCYFMYTQFPDIFADQLNSYEHNEEYKDVVKKVQKDIKTK